VSSLPADPASIEESAAAEDQEHDKDDEERVGVHVFNTGSRRPIRLCSCGHRAGHAQLCAVVVHIYRRQDADNRIQLEQRDRLSREMSRLLVAELAGEALRPREVLHLTPSGVDSHVTSHNGPEGAAMGDKGGKKDKAKSEQQRVNKQKEEQQKKQDKNRPADSVRTG